MSVHWRSTRPSTVGYHLRLFDFEMHDRTSLQLKVN